MKHSTIVVVALAVGAVVVILKSGLWITNWLNMGVNIERFWDYSPEGGNFFGGALASAAAYGILRLLK